MRVLRASPLRGFLLLELALALAVVAGLMTLLVPLLAAQGKLDSARQETLSLQQARDALLRQAVTGSGLPGPVRFAEGTAAGNVPVASHLDLSATLQVTDPGWAGALPGHILGVATVSPLQTAYWYDVQPALRDDASNAFAAAVTTAKTFEPVLRQFDPAVNTKMSTGGYRSQLCRNLNSLLALEQNIRSYTSGNIGDYRRDYINTVLPRVWRTGYESQFSWDLGTGYSTLATATLDAAFDNSSAMAYVVVRRQPPALRRLDRQNTVYEQAGTTGLDQPQSSRGDVYPSAGATRGFRIYENPLTAPFDDPTSDTRDYGGRVQAVSLNEFADSLRQGGLCTTGAETCKAHQLFVRFGNYVMSAPTSGSAQGLTLRWELVEYNASGNTYTVTQSSDVAYGSTSSGVCLDAFSTSVGTQTNNNYLRVSFISPTGSAGYADGVSSLPLTGSWLRGGLLVDPDSSKSADNGLNRWRPLSALNASEAGKTISITCTGSQALLASNELNRSGTSPACTLTTLP